MVPLARLLSTGAAVCAVYSVLYLAVRGTVMDMSVVPAQIITGTVEYPPGHPYDIFHKQVYSLFNYLGAAVWAVAPGSALTWIRNGAFLFLSVFVPFAIAALLSRRALWGYCAAAVTASGTMLQFSGRYPIGVFPTINSDGHIGLQLALVTVVLLLGRFWLSGGLLLGLLPSIHAAMAVIVWPWSVLYLVAQGARPFAPGWRRLTVGWVAGVVVCVALAVAIARVTADAVTPDVAGAADGEVIRAQFTRLTDYHRQQIDPWALAYCFGPMAFAGLAWLLHRTLARSEDRGRVRWLVLLGAIGWSIVYAAAAARGLGWSLPGVVESLMPFRFSNLGVALIVPFAVVLAGASLARRERAENERDAGSVLALVTLAVAALGALLLALPGPLASPPVAFVLLGGALGWSASAWWRDGRAGPLAVSALLLGLLATSGDAELRAGRVLAFGAAWAVTFVALRWMRWNGSWARTLSRDGVLLAACAMAAVAPFRTSPEWRAPFSVVTDWDRELDRWLSTNSRPDELILTPMSMKTELQIKTGHPVLFEMETIYLMQYMPALAPAIGAMLTDLYGIDYTSPARLPIGSDGRVDAESAVWERDWGGRSPEAWQALGEQYHFRFVLSRTALRLPVAVSGPHASLYVIPTTVRRSG